MDDPSWHRCVVLMDVQVAMVVERGGEGGSARERNSFSR